MKLLFVAAAAVAALLLAGSALADQTYTDSSNEAAGSADVSTVTVTNDPINGFITFAIQTNMTTLEPNSEIDVFVDSDNNPTTGGVAGFEYLFGVEPGGWFFSSWNGSDFVDIEPAAGPAVTLSSSGLLTFLVPVVDLGSPATAFNFGVLTFRGPDVNNPIVDQAPDNGVWSYTMVPVPPPPPPPPPPPAPQVTTVAVAAAGAPVHGKVFRISGLTVSLSTGVSTKATNKKCTAKLGGKHLAGTGAGGCTFRLPADAKGKKLVVKVTGTYKTTKVSRTQTYKVK